MAQSDNIPAMLQSGEYVVRKEAVDKLGKDTMDMINNVDRLGYMGGGLVPQGEHGHSAIDELLALNTLANQRSVDMTRDSAMMNKGGKVALPGIPGEYVSKKSKREPNPMSLGLMGSLLSRAFLSDGELVPNYGEFNRLLMNNPEPGDRLTPEEMILKELLGMKEGGKALKKAPEGNKGLMKLPEEVRNRMGYMMEGGMMDNYMYGGMPKKKKKKGYEDGGSVGVVNEIGKARKMFSDIDDLLATAALMDNYTFGPMQRKALRSMREADMVDPKDTMKQVMMLLKAREQNKIPSFEKRKSYLEGGTGYSSPAASGTSTAQSYTPSFLQRGFDIYGGRPEDADILNRVTELFGFDPSVGTGKIQDMIRGYRSEFTGLLPNVQQYGAGFSEFGKREKDIQTARTGAYSEIDRASTDIASSEQDRQMAELIQYLTQLETQGGVKFT